MENNKNNEEVMENKIFETTPTGSATQKSSLTNLVKQQLQLN